MDDLTARTQQELTDIIVALTELTGLPSRWSGRVELVPDAEFKGRKRQVCDIQINAGLAAQDERWPTLIHEALHSISAGYNANDFRNFRGWEEGVVEKLQQIYRPLIFSRLGVEVEESILLTADSEHPFGPYISALEQLRLAGELFLTIKSPTVFYSGLLVIPIPERHASVLRPSLRLNPEKRTQFIAIFSEANAILRRSIV